MPTRRAITLALAAAPLAVTAAEAATLDDPVFAAIEATRDARARVDAMAGTDHDKEDFNALNHAVVDRLAELLAMTPATTGGCAAMMRYVEAHANRMEEEGNDGSALLSGWFEPVSEPAATLLGRLAAVIERTRA